VLSRFSAEPAFSAAVSFGIFVCTAFAFRLHQGIPTAVCVVLMIRNFDRSRPTFMMSGQLPRRLLVGKQEMVGAIDACAMSPSASSAS
jgi:hypothetical protein